MNKQGRPLHALGGFALDAYRLLTFSASNPHSLSKYHALRAVQRRTGATMLLETGTYLGVTTRRCAPHFEKVYTIEIEPELARKAQLFLADYPQVEVIVGDAEREMRRLFEAGVVGDALVFLDGHFSGEGTGMGAEEEPALAILGFMAHHASRLRAIVIDDFRQFGGGAGMPTKWQLVKAAEELFVPQGFRLNIHFDLLFLERLAR